MKFVVFDIETTGWRNTGSDIIEFAYVTVDEYGNVYRAEDLFFYYNGMSWSSEAEKVHGISQDFLKQYEQKFNENVYKMWITLSRADVVGYNSDSFDIPFIEEWCRKLKLPVPEFGRQFDVYKILKRNKMGCKLSDLPDKLSVDREVIKYIEENNFNIKTKAHNASYDATVTQVAFQYCIQRDLVKVQPASVINLDMETDEITNQGLPFWVSDTYFRVIDAEGNEFITSPCPDRSKFRYFMMSIDAAKHSTDLLLRQACFTEPYLSEEKDKDGANIFTLKINNTKVTLAITPNKIEIR